MRSPPQLVRYILVGAIGTAVNYGTFAVLLQTMPYQVASAVGYVLGTFAAYSLNRRWTFGIDRHRTRYLLRYAAVQVGGMAATVMLLTFLVEVAGSPALLGQLVALATVTLATFQINGRWSFGGLDGQAA